MSVIPLSLLTALRFSRGKKRSGMVSLISIFSTMGIALGVAVLIIGLSAMNGFERELHNRVLAIVPHGDIRPFNASDYQVNDVISNIEKNSNVVGASAFVTFTGLVESGINLETIQIKGFLPEQEKKITALPNFVTDDAWNKLFPDQDMMILGAGIAKRLNVKTGDSVTIIIPNNSTDTKIQQPKRIRLKIIGLIQLGGLVDNNLGLIHLRDAQKYLAMTDEVTGFGVKLQDPFTADIDIRNIGLGLNIPLEYDTWVSQYGFMYQDIKMVRGIMYLAMVLVMSVACFNIVSTLVVAVKDKSTDIAILRTLGATNKYVLSIFIWYGVLSGLIGTVIGCVIGILSSIFLTTIIQFIEKMVGIQFLSADIYFVDFLPSEVHSVDIIIVFVTSIVLSLLASLYPANRAIKLEPARILSGQ